MPLLWSAMVREYEYSKEDIYEYKYSKKENFYEYKYSKKEDFYEYKYSNKEATQRYILEIFVNPITIDMENFV